MTGPVVSCRRCGHPYAWASTVYPTAENVRALGREIREHYETAHPGVETGR